MLSPPQASAGRPRSTIEAEGAAARIVDASFCEAIVDSLEQGVCVFDANRRVALCNRRWARIYGLTPEQARPGAALQDVVAHCIAASGSAMDAGAYLSFWAQLDERGEPGDWTFPLEAGRAIRVRHHPMPGGGWLTTHEDLAERRLHARPEILEMIALGAPLEQTFDRLVRFIEAEVEGAIASIRLVGDRRARRGAAPGRDRTRKAMLARSTRTASRWAPIVSRTGALLGVLSVRSSTQRPIAIESWVMEDATRTAALAIERKLADDHLRFLADHDPLTGLANRTLLQERFARDAGHARQHGRSVTVAYVDLDHFKLVNDRLGHEVGDRLLKIVGDRLRNCVRKTDTVARLGGDEFAVILADQPRDDKRPSAALEKIRAAVAGSVCIDGYDLDVSGSVGAASFPAHGADLDALLTRADAAMYQAKHRGRASRLTASASLLGLRALLARKGALLQSLVAFFGRREAAAHPRRLRNSGARG